MYAVEFDNDRLAYPVRQEIKVETLAEAIEVANTHAATRPAGDKVRIGMLVKSYYEFRGTVRSIPHPELIGVVGYDQKIHFA